MFAALAAISIGYSAQTIELTPTDDVWVYPHASDPHTGSYLRVWGSDGQAVAADPSQADSYSYSYLKFDLAKLPKGAKMKSAILILTHTPDPTWPISDAKESPMEARVLKGKFEEKTWEFSLGRTVFPAAGKESIFGTFAPSKVEAGQPIKFEIDLLKGPAKWTPDGYLSLALTSRLDASANGNRPVYKFHSKDSDKTEYRPKLVLGYETSIP